uniref:Uncharacterized protein n=1 Tax=Knipowitschia caucasica TaxID=637954 RepID=A0AAV2IUD4_KNICA
MEAQTKVGLLQKETQDQKREVSYKKTLDYHWMWTGAAQCKVNRLETQTQGLKDQRMEEETLELKTEVSSLASALEDEKNNVSEAHSEADIGPGGGEEHHSESPNHMNML